MLLILSNCVRSRRLDIDQIFLMRFKGRTEVEVNKMAFKLKEFEADIQLS